MKRVVHDTRSILGESTESSFDLQKLLFPSCFSFSSIITTVIMFSAVCIFFHDHRHSFAVQGKSGKTRERT